MYRINDVLKLTEEDQYQEGCIPETSKMYSLDISFIDSSLEGLVKQLKEYFDCEDDAMLFNSCDEIGRIDIQLLEDDQSITANKKDIALWKEGKKTLYLSVYSMTVHKLIEVDLSLFNVQ